MMLDLYTPNKIKVKVPETQIEDDTPRFNLDDDLKKANDYYNDYGYVIFSSAVSVKSCEKLREYWNKEVKPHKGTIYRQATAKAEKNIFNEKKWIMNPILNLQSINPNLFKNLRNNVEKEVFSNFNICKVLKSILGDKPKIVQSMYFEGNSATWEHQDTYYLDSEKIGVMTAGWLALEEIKADAGRFFICPLSHKIDLGKQNSTNNVAENHVKYIEEVVATVKSKNMTIKAPYMNVGDILFWNSRTIHGSLDSQNANFSRSSITLHAIPQSHKLLQFHARELELKTDDLENSLVHRPKDQAKILNKIILSIESNFPKPFYWLKNLAIKKLIK